MRLSIGTTPMPERANGAGLGGNRGKVRPIGTMGGVADAAPPIDHAYPRHPMSAYRLSKRLGEEVCRAFSARHGLVTVSLRPVLGTDPDRHAALRRTLPVAARVERGRTESWLCVGARRPRRGRALEA